jgi:hypothetical protein
MYEILGAHRQDFAEVRRLCLICHGLDLSSDKLFNDSTYNNKLNATKEVYQNLVSGSLLSLAVAIRINIYQGKLEKQREFPITHCCFCFDDEGRIHEDFKIKDVCDKIIHADSITKHALPSAVLGNTKMLMQLKGKHNGKIWILDISLELFAEAVLNLLDNLEENMPNRP